MFKPEMAELPASLRAGLHRPAGSVKKNKILEYQEYIHKKKDNARRIERQSRTRA